jgi:hypothetical protein
MRGTGVKVLHEGYGLQPVHKALTVLGINPRGASRAKATLQQNRAVLGLNIWLDTGEPGNYQTEQIMQNGKFLSA